MLLSRKIKDYESKYRDKCLKISAEISNFLNIKSEVNLKVRDFIATGVIYSVSMNSIKVIFLEEKILLSFSQNQNLGDLYFKQIIPSGSPSFKIIRTSVKLLNLSNYSTQDKKYNLLTLCFLSTLPEEIVAKIGKLLDLKLGQNQRIYDRIPINVESIRKLNLNDETAIIEVNSARHKCIIKDLSYGGALLISCLDKKLNGNEEVNLIFNFSNLNKEVLVSGKIMNLSVIQIPKEKVLALGIVFNESKVPLSYSMAIHDYFN